MNKPKRALRDYQDLQFGQRTELTTIRDGFQVQSVYAPRQPFSESVHECDAGHHAVATLPGLHHDLACRVVTRAELGDLSTLEAADRSPVSSIMTKDVVCVRPDVSIGALTALLLDLGLSGLPVIDDTGHAIGVVSKTDLVRYHHELGEHSRSESLVEEQFELGFRGELGAPSTVADIMTPVVFTVPEGASIASAAAVMSYRNVHRVPVVDATGAVVGVLSSIDIVDWVAQGAPEQFARRRSNVIDPEN